jgi:hypothetical protein
MGVGRVGASWPIRWIVSGQPVSNSGIIAAILIDGIVWTLKVRYNYTQTFYEMCKDFLPSFQNFILGIYK